VRSFNKKSRGKEEKRNISHNNDEKKPLDAMSAHP
jgi:hypothetical protein